MYRLITAAALMASPALAGDSPHASIKLISADEAKACKPLGIASGSRLATWSVSKSTEAALTAALKKAENEGADAAVIMNTTADHNVYTVALQTYRCGPVD